MFRTLNLVALLYAVGCVVLIVSHLDPPSLRHLTRSTSQPSPGDGASWFQSIKPYCNPLEVETRVAAYPPPNTVDGSAYRAACFALAGKMDRARQALQNVPSGDSQRATQIVFGLAHEVADAGDDKAATPIMKLVLEFDPNHVMALYHAGMAEYAQGDYVLAREHLSRFVKLYQKQDALYSNAMDVLNRLN